MCHNPNALWAFLSFDATFAARRSSY